MPQDIAKICYQAAMGAEHLLADTTAARRYFDAEFDSTEPREGELYELLSDDVCRIDLGAWRATGMPREWLFNMFVGTATVERCGRAVLEEYLAAAEEVVSATSVAFSNEEWRNFMEKYRVAGLPAVHHSQNYRENEHPAYRIVDRRFLPCLPILSAAAEFDGKAEEGRARVIAIDGRAASGKTTLADSLAIVLGAGVVRMDDFFLLPSLRSAERLEECGGNVHYERFCEEILPEVAAADAFSYRAFDCSVMELGGERRIQSGEWRIVEGSYSHHPKFGDYADLRVFCTVSPDEQMRRILLRNGERWAERFKNEWIPMEEKYFAAFGIREGADILI